jgi:hypothetical protein
MCPSSGMIFGVLWAINVWNIVVWIETPVVLWVSANVPEERIAAICRVDHN